jgi:hypothetical protein
MSRSLSLKHQAGSAIGSCRFAAIGSAVGGTLAPGAVDRVLIGICDMRRERRSARVVPPCLALGAKAG